jgi:hypothetical protein
MNSRHPPFHIHKAIASHVALIMRRASFDLTRAEHTAICSRLADAIGPGIDRAQFLAACQPRDGRFGL